MTNDISISRIGDNIKIIFVQPDGSGIPSMGIMSLSAMLKKKGYKDITICDICETIPYHERTLKYFKEQLEKKPDIVAFTATTPIWTKTKELIPIARPFCKTIILGGPHATLFQEKILETCPEIDILVIGESDNTIDKLVKAIEKKRKLNNINGLIYRQNKKIIKTKPNDYIQNLDDYPFPDRESININSYHTPFSILTSRGCPYNCEFCFKTVTGYKWRGRSAENIVKEIEYLIKKYPDVAKGPHKAISIVDDTFNCNIKRAKKICDLIIQKKLNIEISSVNGFHAKNTDYELFQKAKKAGFKEIWFGIESGNDKILKNLRKGITKDDVRRAVKFARKAGIEMIGGHFILGLSYETPETARDTIAFAKELQLDNLGFNHANVLPGTRLWDYIQKHGTILYDYSEMDFSKFRQMAGYPIIETPEFTKEQRIEVHKEAMNMSAGIIRKRVMTKENIKRFIFRKDSYKDMIWAIKRLYELQFKTKTDKWRHKNRKPSEQHR